jgi:hypothetical protein
VRPAPANSRAGFSCVDFQVCDIVQPHDAHAAGNERDAEHSDIGGSYPENESRLSDIALQWMSDFIANEIPEAGRVQIDRRVLTLFPSYDGMMHDECMVGIGGTPLHCYPRNRDVPSDATLHPTVYQRLELASVRNFTSYGPYRPANHAVAKKYFTSEALAASSAAAR